MAKLKINLLPPEIEAQRRQQAKKSTFLLLSIGFLMLVVAIAAVVLSLRLSQNLIFSQVNKDLTGAKNKISQPGYNQKEGLLVTLKNRLDSIANINSQETYASYAFGLITSLTPLELRLNNVAIDNKGKVKLTTQTASIAALEAFFNNLVDPQQTSQKITAVNIDGVTKLGSGFYQADLTLTLAGAAAKEGGK